MKKLMDLKGRNSLLTGAGGNLGKVFAHTLAELGSSLILADRVGEDLDSLANELEKSYGVSVITFHFDLESEKERSIAILEILKVTKDLSVLVNNAAFVGTREVNGWNAPFAEQSLSAWKRAMEVNVTAAFDLSKNLAPIMKKSLGSSIINIGSIYGKHGPDWSLYEDTEIFNIAAYAASKGALLQLNKWLARTLAPEIRVNAISPGGIFRNQDEKFVARYERRTPLGRMATEKDLVGALAFLATDLSSYVTGQNLEIDGGWGV